MTCSTPARAECGVGHPVQDFGRLLLGHREVNHVVLELVTTPYTLGAVLEAHDGRHSEGAQLEGNVRVLVIHPLIVLLPIGKLDRLDLAGGAQEVLGREGVLLERRGPVGALIEEGEADGHLGRAAASGEVQRSEQLVALRALPE